MKSHRPLATWIGGLCLLIAAGCASPFQEEAVDRHRPQFAVPVREISAGPLARSTGSSPAAVPEAGRALPLTLSQALQLALAHHPALTAAEQDVGIASAGRLQAGLAPNPMLMAMVEEFGGTGPMHEFDSAMSSIRLAQTLEMGDKRHRRVAAATAEMRLAQWDREALRLEVAVDATRRFVAVLEAHALLELRRRSVVLAEQTFDLVKLRVTAGTVAPSDLERAAVRVSIEKQAEHRAARQLEAGRRQLEALWSTSGSPVRVDKAEGAFERLSPVSEQAPDAALLTGHPSLARWDDEGELRRSRLKLEESAAVSDITVGGGVKYMAETDDTVFILEAGIPLTVADRNQGNIAAGRLKVAQARHQRAAREAELISRLADQHAAARSAWFEASRLQQETLPAARAVHEAAKNEFQAGTTSYLEVLDAERTLIETETMYLEALAAYHNAVAEVEALTGRPLADPDPKTETPESNE